MTPQAYLQHRKLIQPWPLSASGVPLPAAIPELEYFQHLIKGFPDMFKDHIDQFRTGTKARFWLQNAKLRVANVHLQRLKLLDLQSRMELVPKDDAELKQLHQTIDLIHPALKEYGTLFPVLPCEPKRKTYELSP